MIIIDFKSETHQLYIDRTALITITPQHLIYKKVNRLLNMEQINNLLNSILTFLKKTKFYPLILQILLVFLLGFTILSLLSKNQNTFSTLNPGMILLWHIWWPAIPLIILLTGRLWCSVCPFSSIAIMLNKIFPYRLLDSGKLIKYGFIIGLFVFTALLALDNMFTVAFNPHYTGMFLLSLLSLLVIIAILYDCKTYCNTVCPFGLLSRVYNRFSFMKIAKSDEICSRCDRTDWIESKPIRHDRHNNTPRLIRLNRDWKTNLECLKKCDAGSMKIAYVNPFRSIFSNRKLELIEVLIPSTIIVLFANHVFIKSAYFIHLYNDTQSLIALDLSHFIILWMALIFFINISLNLFIIYISNNLLRVNKYFVYKSIICITPLLIFFHIALMLHDISEIASAGHIYPILNFLDISFLSEKSLQLIAYILTSGGIILSIICFISLIRSLNYYHFTPPSGFSVVFMVIFMFYSTLSLTTIKYLHYFGC